MTNRQYIACVFRPGDRRSYTYHNDGEPVTVGDRVVVSTDRGAQAITVTEIIERAPTFATKGIAGKERAPEQVADETTTNEGSR